MLPTASKEAIHDCSVSVMGWPRGFSSVRFSLVSLGSTGDDQLKAKPQDMARRLAEKMCGYGMSEINIFVL